MDKYINKLEAIQAELDKWVANDGGLTLAAMDLDHLCNSLIDDIHNGYKYLFTHVGDAYRNWSDTGTGREIIDLAFYSGVYVSVDDLHSTHDGSPEAVLKALVDFFGITDNDVLKTVKRDFNWLVESMGEGDYDSFYQCTSSVTSAALGHSTLDRVVPHNWLDSLSYNYHNK